jgi:hypothetical protein
MKIAILILAHSNIEQLRSLVDSLKNDFRVYIHIDAKSDIPAQIFEGEKNVEVIKTYKIYWGSHEMIYATLDLLKLAYNDGCDYFMLISGQDMRISPCSKIKAEIESKPDINYLSYEPLPRTDWAFCGGIQRLTLYWGKFKSRDRLTFRNILNTILRKTQSFLGIKRRLFAIKYYGGSSWFNISREVTKFIINFTVENPAFYEQFKYTLSGDEIYFQTLIMNSPFADKVVNDDKRYIDWASGPEFPRTLRIEDFDKIKASGDFFARKFDWKTDKEVIEKITAII